MSSNKANRHDKYYFDDGNVVFLTKDKTLFRLHKSILKLNSTFFDDLFGLDQPTVEDKTGKILPPEGLSDERPIVSDVQDVELESICVALYEMSLNPASELDIDQAVALLHVSTKFQFEKIYKRVTDMLDIALIPPWQRYALGVDCLVDPWILRSYVEICSTVEYHPAELVAEFSQRNSMDKLSRILKLREQYRTQVLLYTRSKSSYPYPKLDNPPSSICSECLPELKQVLAQVLSGNATAGLDAADAAATPLLRERITKAMQPPCLPANKICPNCRKKEYAIVQQLLGLEELEAEIKKVMHWASS